MMDIQFTELIYNAAGTICLALVIVLVLRLVLLGRLTKDPEIRYTPSGACVAQFTLAVDRPYTKDGSREADFIPCVTWGKTSETIGNYVHKGQRLLVEGRLQIRSYDAKDGSKRWVTEVIVNHAEFI